ncbi:MAG: TonB-dependent receptor [Sphingobacteriales bacterium]|nr:MAG: TonB-dependent receptor [Sphingobacteriales bacterium]
MPTTIGTRADTIEKVACISSTFSSCDKVGVSLSASSQTRDSRAVVADIASWRNDLTGYDATLVTDNRADKSGHVYYPRNFGYHIDDYTRDRTNGQAVLQFAPIETIKATLDYTYAKSETQTSQLGTGIWYSDSGGNLASGVIDKNGTMITLTENGADFAYNQSKSGWETENKSIGFNLEWKATENLTLDFDAHNSTSDFTGTGRGNDVFIILAANQIQTKTYDASSGKDIPDMTVIFNPTGTGIVNGMPTAGSIDSLFIQAGRDVTGSEVDQYQLNGVWENSEDNGVESIAFGLANSTIANRSRDYNSGQIPAGWYGGNTDLYPDEIFTEHKLAGLMPSLSGGGTNVKTYFDFNFEEAYAAFREGVAEGRGSFGTHELNADTSNPADLINDNRIEEETTSVYLQLATKSDFSGMPLSIIPGVRYERTAVIGNSYQKDPIALVWLNPTEWTLNRAAVSTYTNQSADYNIWLPSLNTSLEVTEDVVTRFSYSKSITRPKLDDMYARFSVTDRPKPGARSGNAGNPALKPFTADNFDISAEWYYGEASYVSAGFFAKQVENFIVTEFVERTVGDLRDPAAGPRYQQAVAQLTAEGTPTTDENIYDRIALNTGATEGIVQNGSDPLAQFQIATPANQESVNVYGIELAVQHMFGESGFGVQANATIVNGDINVDNAATDFQFAIFGMSDSANLVGFYEKDGFQARLAYNWRDTFLNGVGENNTPNYTEEYGQLDASVSYELPWVEGLTISFDAVNITDASQRQYSRYENQFKHAEQYGARYALGARYKF